MEKIVKGSSYNTVRDTRIVGVKGVSLFISNSGNFYLYTEEDQIIPQEKYEVVEWSKINFFNFSQAEIERLKRFVELSGE